MCISPIRNTKSHHTQFYETVIQKFTVSVLVCQSKGLRCPCVVLVLGDVLSGGCVVFASSEWVSRVLEAGLSMY